MKSKATATLLTLFLGGMGIHKFYLGRNLAGVLYLLFFWTFIPVIIAFFEFFVLIMMSDQDFNAKYNEINSQYAGVGVESSYNKTETLMRLKGLYDSGVITAEEYEVKRRRFLDSL